MNRALFLYNFEQMLMISSNFKARCSYVLANYLYLRLKQLPVNNMNFIHILPGLCVDLMNELGESPHDFPTSYRQRFLQETGWTDIPSITTPTGHDVRRGYLIAVIRTIMDKVDLSVSARIQDYMLAGNRLLEQTFVNFLRNVYWGKLQKKLNPSQGEYYFTGTYGTVQLNCMLSGSTVTIEFIRVSPSDNVDHVQFGMINDKNLLHEQLGLTYLNGPIHAALQMMEEVEQNWRTHERLTQ